MEAKGRGGCIQEQDCLNWQFQVIIKNSPHTGAHDMQIYERTLSPGGLSIKFKRLRDEKPLQVVNGILKRVK